MPLIGFQIATTTDNFSKMVNGKYLLVDKSLMLQEFFESSDEALLITRPRRFGKTLNLSMLQHFFAAEVDGQSTQGLFDQFAIAKVDDGAFLREHQGQYPVIFTTFKDVKEPTFEGAINKIRSLIQELYRQHRNSLASEHLDEAYRAEFEKYRTGQANTQELEGALKFLSEFLHKAHGKRVIILIDEYDAPLTSAYEHKYLDTLGRFMGNIFLSTLKGNGHLEKGLMTGILRVSQNSMLSDLNNLEVYTLLENNYQQYFGFTEEEIIELTEYTKNTKNTDNIRDYYNGYKMGGQIIYNPWSAMNYFKKGNLRPYWVLTSNDRLLKDVLLNSNDVIKGHLYKLMQGEIIEAEISVNVSYLDLMKKSDAIWTLLLFCGYLTVENSASCGSRFTCKLKIPNQEILAQYQEVFMDWLKEKIGADKYHSFLKDLVEDRIGAFAEKLRNYLLGCTGSKDFGSESNYHTFVLGLLASITDTHYLLSNKEAGLGFPDVMLIPKNENKTQGIILEFKYVSFKKRHPDDRKNIKYLYKATRAEVVKGLRQIDIRGYDFTFSAYPNIKELIKIGIAFANRYAAVGSVKTTLHENGNLVTQAFKEEDITFYDGEITDEITSQKRKHDAIQDENKKLSDDVSSKRQRIIKKGALSNEEVRDYCLSQQIDGFRDIAGDGNCFFRAVLLACGQDQNDHQNLRECAVQYIGKNATQFPDETFAITRDGCEQVIALGEYLDIMVKQGSYAEGPILEVTGLLLNCQIDVIQLGRTETGEIKTEGRFTMAAVDNADYTILLVRVNNNHYHVGQDSPALTTSTCLTTQTQPMDGKISASIQHTLLSSTSSSSPSTQAEALGGPSQTATKTRKMDFFS